MIVVWNNNHGQMFGFDTIEEYKTWIMEENQIDGICGFDNTIYDIKNGEECTDEKEVDLHQWHCDYLK